VQLAEFEEQATTRVKFASTRGRRLVGDATAEYLDLLPQAVGDRAEWFPPDWKVVETGTVTTLPGNRQNGWRVESAGREIALVQHETGKGARRTR
jgi:hypothetical protein